MPARFEAEQLVSGSTVDQDAFIAVVDPGSLGTWTRNPGGSLTVGALTFAPTDWAVFGPYYGPSFPGWTNAVLGNMAQVLNADFRNLYV